METRAKAVTFRRKPFKEADGRSADKEVMRALLLRITQMR
jgi:hypothetical protein